MSVVIKGMKLPKNCLLCPCCVGEGIGAGRQHYCQAIDDEPCVSETYRPKNCPLVEIRAPHGRLIDADELQAAIHGCLCETCETFECEKGIGCLVEDVFNLIDQIEAEVSE